MRPAVKAHLSFLLALIALTKAAGYFLQRYQLVTSNNGYVEGAGYTDVHARLPALAPVLDLVGRGGGPPLQHPAPGVDPARPGRRRVGVRRPGGRGDLSAVLQALGEPGPEHTGGCRTSSETSRPPAPPTGSTTCRAPPYGGASSVTSSQLNDSQQTLANIRLWDPDPQIALQTFQKLQGVKSYSNT